ncbi:translocation/assembly module TamB domain-containing protein [Muricoccus pecuniae]|uniref:Translocation and assembly module TamB n=1 Tax=Muricoccus pecuniae TaxID=693023 RepID=A0A840YAV7_9PROT|nr:translocation/assembly module TamB domain-containing protein [Roseomonas pecuniae]MBB5695839.1 translocation and assembly module TamB [Roseomonas pecuniae]
MRWVGRILLSLLGVAVVLPVVLLAGAWAALNLRPGQEALAGLAMRFVPGLEIENLHGGLPAAPRIGRVVLSDREGPYLVAEDIALDLDLLRLASREFRVSNISAGRVAFTRLPVTEPRPEPQPAEPAGPVIPQLPQLPVEVALERLALPRIELGRAVAGIPAVLSLEAGGRLGADGAFIGAKGRRLDAPGSLDLDLALAPGQRMKIDLSYDEAPGGLVASLLGKPEGATRLRVELDGPASGAALNLLADLGETARLEGRGTVSLPAGGGVGLEASGNAALGGFLPPPLAALRFDFRTSPAGGGGTRIERARIDAGAAAVEARGTLGEALDLAFEARVGDAAALAGLVPPTVGWSAVEASGSVTGTTAAPELRVEATLRQPRLPEPAPALLGEAPTLLLRANREHLHELAVNGRAVTLRAEGGFGERLNLTINAALAAEDIPAAPVRGRLSAEARVTGPASEPAVALRAESPELEAYGRRFEALRLEASLPRATVPAGSLNLSARLQNMPLTAEARAAQEGEVIRVQTLRAALGPARLEGSGEVNTATALARATLLLEATDLAPLTPVAGAPLGGGLRVSASLAPREAGAERRQGIEAEIRANDLRAGGQVVNGTIQANGTDAALDLRADLRALEARATLRARLALHEPEKRIDLAALDVTRQALGVRLSAPATILLTPGGGVSTEGLSLQGRPGGTLRVTGRWGPENADLRATLTSLPLGIANLFLPEPALSGTLSGDVRLSGPVARPGIEGDLRGTGLRAGAPWARGLPEGTLQATARMRGESVETQAEFRLGQALRLNLQARLPSDFAGPIEATLRGTTDIGVIAAPFLLSGANRVAGTVAIDARAGGTVAEPQVSGTARLSNGSFRNLEYGLALRDIRGTVRGDADRIVVESITARAGPGTLTARGDLRPFAEGQPIDLSVTGQNLQPVSSDLLRGAFDTDLRLSGSVGDGMRLAGAITARNATIGIPEGLPGGVPDIGEVREVGRNIPSPPPGTAAARRAAGRRAAPPPSDAPPLALDIAFRAPGQIYLRGRGLDVELGGDVRIAGTISDPQASGALRLRRGNLTVLDRRLNFERGVLTFQGDVASPEIDLLATSRASSTTINVTVTGTPRAPKIEFTSSPELPQDEVLARLIFNRSADKLSPFQIAQLARVLSGALAGGKEDPVSGVLGRVSRSLGLDRLGIGTGANGTPGIEAGGYLGQGIYLNVDPGTSTGSPRVGVEIELTPRLKLESGAGADSQGAGITYEYEY